jgi:hypothetical protein
MEFILSYVIVKQLHTVDIDMDQPPRGPTVVQRGAQRAATSQVTHGPETQRRLGGSQQSNI